MKLIVGLGNPGKEYEKTRHNIGFMVLDNYLGNVNFKVKDNYAVFEKVINGDKVIFLKPLTFMNESGLAVKKVLDYYKISIDDLLVIHDDMDFEVGSFKLKAAGSSAGHNGIKSVIKHIGTENFKRLRIGISKIDDDIVNYVLGKFNNEETEKINKVLYTANNIIDDYLIMDFNKLMNKYN